MASGEAMIAATEVRGRQYLKFTLLNPETRIRDLQAILRLIKRHGSEYRGQRPTPTTPAREPENEELICD